MVALRHGRACEQSTEQPTIVHRSVFMVGYHFSRQGGWQDREPPPHDVRRCNIWHGPRSRSVRHFPVIIDTNRKIGKNGISRKAHETVRKNAGVSENRRLCRLRGVCQQFPIAQGTIAGCFHGGNACCQPRSHSCPNA